jgi:hypothetical protein
MIELGFTGTRHGMTDAQREAFRKVFWELPDRVGRFNHGACKGADAEAAAIVRGFHLGTNIAAYPGRGAHDEEGDENPWLDKEALNDADEIHPTKTHFARNRDIVNAVDVLIACPPCKPLPSSGGTAYTVTFARKSGKRVIIVWPDGTVEDEGASA